MVYARRILDRIVGTVCCLILGGMVLVLAWQVFSRYALNAPSTYSEEILRYGMIWSSLLGAAFACGQQSHMAIYLLRDTMSGRVRTILNLLTPLAFIIFACAVLIAGGLRAVDVAQSQTSPVMQIPMVWVYVAMPVSGVLIVIYSVLELIEASSGTRLETSSIEQSVISGE